MKSVTLYTKTTCPYCIAAKELLDEIGAEYKEIVISDMDNPDEYYELTEKHNHKTVPMIFIGDEFVGGYDDLSALKKEGKLEEEISNK